MGNFLTTKQKIFLGLILVFIFLNIMVWQEVFALAGEQYFKVNFLDIGQGDSIFIQTPSRRTILIDGGPSSVVLEKLGKYLPFWEKSLDVVMLTHPDQDHIMGLFSVLEKYKVDYILWTGMVRDGANYERWVNLLKKKEKEGSKIIMVNANTRIESGGVFIKTLNPTDNLEGKYIGKDDNDTGIVWHASFGKNAFLFMADTSIKVEQALVNRKVNLFSDVLKVGHHGSKYSTSEALLKAVHPKMAVISVGKNSYGHPTQEVLLKLQKFGIKILRTDESGDVLILSDGENIKVISDTNY